MNSVFYKEDNGKLSVMPGTNVDTAINEAIAMSKSQGITVSFDFNDQEIVVNQNSTLESARKDWADKMEQARIEYEKSPEYAKAQRETELRRQNAQNSLDELMGSIGGIDFSNLEQLLPFLGQLLISGDHVGTTYDRQQVIEILQAHGYSENMNCNSETYTLDVNDKEAVGKWIVGQYMSTTYPGIAHQVEKWEQQFIEPQMTEGQVKK